MHIEFKIVTVIKHCEYERFNIFDFINKMKK